MNQVILIGRLTDEPKVYPLKTEDTYKVTYTLAINRPSNDGDSAADFIPCVTFGSPAKFAKEHLHKGMKIAVTGRIQTGHYTKDDGTEKYFTSVSVFTHEFCEPKKCVEGGGTNE